LLNPNVMFFNLQVTFESNWIELYFDLSSIQTLQTMIILHAFTFGSLKSISKKLFICKMDGWDEVKQGFQLMSSRLKPKLKQKFLKVLDTKIWCRRCFRTKNKFTNQERQKRRKTVTSEKNEKGFEQISKSIKMIK
jgi:hypothetical protein